MREGRFEIAGRASTGVSPPRECPLECRAALLEFGVEISEYRGVVRVPRRVFQRLLPERPTPERCVEAYYFQRTRFECIAERKLRRRQLTEDGDVEVRRAGPVPADSRRSQGIPKPPQSAESGCGAVVLGRPCRLPPLSSGGALVGRP